MGTTCSRRKPAAPGCDIHPGTLLNEIYTAWRAARHRQNRHRPLDYAKIWRIAQSKDREAGPVRHVLFAVTGCSWTSTLG